MHSVTLPVYYMYTTCTLPVYYMYTTCYYMHASYTITMYTPFLPSHQKEIIRREISLDSH